MDTSVTSDGAPYARVRRRRNTHGSRSSLVGALLDGKRIDMPPIRQARITYKRAPKALPKAADQRSMFGKEDEPVF